MITPADLSATRLFRDSTEATLAFAARNAGDVEVEADAWIIREGETAHFFIVLQGTLAILKTVAGETAKLGEYGAGDSFGEVPLLLGSPAVANIRATTTARLARLDAMAFWHVMHADERFAHTVFKNMSKRVAHIREVVAETPEARCTITGDSRSAACHELRDFLTRMHVPYEWEERNGGECDVSFAQGPPLHSPAVCNVAERLGLSLVPDKITYDVVIVVGGLPGWPPLSMARRRD